MMAEIVMTGTRRHDKCVVKDLVVLENDFAVLRIEIEHFAEEHLHILLTFQNRTERRRNVTPLCQCR